MNIFVLLLSTVEAVAGTELALARVKDLTKPEKLSLSPEKDSSVEQYGCKISVVLPLDISKKQNSHRRRVFRKN